MLSYAAPWALLAANFGIPDRTKHQVALIGSFGIALPLIVSTSMVAFASEAAHAPFRNIAGALWYHDAARYFPALMMLAAITMFGAARLGVKALADTLSIFKERRVVYRCVFGTVVIGSGTLAALLAPNKFSLDLPLLLTPLARVLGTVAAILTADVILRWRPLKPRRIDWIGMFAFLVGWAAPCYLPDWTPGAGPWLLASYAIAFVVCASGRAIQKIRVRDSAPA
jgi:hypothetical protein